MLTIKQIADICHWKHGQLIAHGYTFDRETVDVWYYAKKYGVNDRHRLVKYCGDKLIMCISVPNLEKVFHRNIKRWYADKTDENLIKLCAQFGLLLPLTRHYDI